MLLVCELHLMQAAGLGSKPSFTAEREAAFKIGALLPKLSVGCLEPPEERQGCRASDERQDAFELSVICKLHRTQVLLLDLARRKA